MSIVILALLVLVVLVLGATVYMLLGRLVAPARVIAACVPMVSVVMLVLIVEHLRTAVQPTNSSETSTSPVTATKGAPVISNSTHDAGPAPDLPLQHTSKEDQIFLDRIVETQNQGRRAVPTQVHDTGKPRIVDSGKEPPLKAELAVNTTGTQSSEPAMHKETVKRAQLVTHSETFKHLEAARTRP